MIAALLFVPVLLAILYEIDSQPFTRMYPIGDIKGEAI